MGLFMQLLKALFNVKTPKAPARRGVSAKAHDAEDEEEEEYGDNQDDNGGNWYNFHGGERPPEHEWRLYPPETSGQGVAFGVAGLEHRIDAATDFLTAAHEAETSNGRYGLLLERDPSNPYDANAIKILAWLKDPTAATHIGYLRKKDAARIAQEFPTDMPISALLRAVFVASTGRLWVGIRLLIPAQRDPWWKER